MNVALGKTDPLLIAAAAKANNLIVATFEYE